MQIDELRSELTTLADEIEPLRGDVRALHRRQRRRRVASSLVVALAVVVAVSTIVVVRHRDNGKVRVTGAGPKEVPAAADHSRRCHRRPRDSGRAGRARRVARRRRSLRRDVLRARIARRNSCPLPIPRLAPFCALESSDGFAVQAIDRRHLGITASPEPATSPAGDGLRRFVRCSATTSSCSSRSGRRVAQVGTVRAAHRLRPRIAGSDS